MSVKFSICGDSITSCPFLTSLIPLTPVVPGLAIVNDVEYSAGFKIVTSIEALAIDLPDGWFSRKSALIELSFPTNVSDSLFQTKYESIP